MTEDNGKLVIPEKKTPLERLGENIEVLSTRFNKVEGRIDNLGETTENINQRVRNIYNDLDNPKPSFGRTPTRTIALEALKKAQHETRLDDLKEHGVIKGIKEDMDKQDTKFENSLLKVKRRLNEIPSTSTLHELLKSDFEFQDLKKKIEENEESQGVLSRHGIKYQEQINDIQETYNGADHPTGPQFDELTLEYEELKIRHNDLVHFLKGVFSSMKLDPVAKCIEEYKLKSKMEKTDNEDNRANPE